MSVEDTKDSVILEISESEMVSITEICRLCANQSDKLVAVYSGEGIANDLANKMNLYLPIKVSETDDLPLQCCWGCASTVLAWHELVVASVEADRRLRNCTYKIVSGPKILTTSNDFDSTDAVVCDVPVDNEEHDVEEEETPVHMSTSLNAFCQTDDPASVASGDNFDSYITSLEHPFITEDSLHETQPIIEFKSEGELHLMEPKSSENVSCQISINEKSSDVDTTKEESKENEDKPECYNFACHLCPSLFILQEDIMKHFEEVHPEEIQDTVKEEDKVKSHESKKEKRKRNKIDQAAINEARVSVEGRVYYNCKLCGKSLHSPYTYIWHMRIHTGERPYVCDLCGKQFRVSQGLIRHVRETHEGIKNFPCDLCGRMFATRRNVEEHRRIHTNERPYICDLCGKAFKQKASLFVHNRSHNDSFPFRCSYCNQGFRTKPPLLLHITRHTGEKPYPCEVCGRRFRIKYELKRHKLIHSDEKPFACCYCGLRFRQKRYVKNHTKLNHSDMILKND